MSSEDRDSGMLSFLVGMGIGAAAAAIAALLYAPRRGTDTRRGVTDAVRTLRGRAEELAERVRGASQEVTERLKQDLDAAITAGKEAVEARRAELGRTTESE